MKCAICGKEECTKVYATIWIKNPICNNCYNQAKLIDSWAKNVIELIPKSVTKDKFSHVIYKNAFGETVQEWKYCYWKNAIKRAQKITNQIMGPFFED